MSASNVLLAGSEAEVRHLLSKLVGQATERALENEAVETQLTGQVGGLLSLQPKRTRGKDGQKKSGRLIQSTRC